MQGETSKNIFGISTDTDLEIDISLNFIQDNVIYLSEIENISVIIPENNESNISVNFKILNVDSNTTYQIISDSISSGSFLNLDGTDGISGKIDDENLNLLLSDETFTPNKIYFHKIRVQNSDGNSFEKSFRIAIPVPVSGKAIDGYISGASVNVIDINSSEILATVLTDENGSFSFNKPAKVGIIIEISGGVDTATGEHFSGNMKNIIDKNSSTPKLNVTPLTSLIVNLVESGESVEDAKNILVTSLGIDTKTLDSDPIDILKNGTSEEKLESAKAMKTIITIQKFAEIIASVSENSEEAHEDVFKAIAEKMRDSNISKVLENSSDIIDEVASSKGDLEVSKLEAIKELTQNTITILDEINVTELAEATDIDEQIKSNASAVEILVIPLKAKLENIKDAEDLSEVNTSKNEALKVVVATIALGGIDEISKILDIKDENSSISDFANDFLDDGKIESESTKFQAAIDSRKTIDEILDETSENNISSENNSSETPDNTGGDIPDNTGNENNSESETVNTNISVSFAPTLSNFLVVQNEYNLTVEAIFEDNQNITDVNWSLDSNFSFLDNNYSITILDFDENDSVEITLNLKNDKNLTSTYKYQIGNRPITIPPETPIIDLDENITRADAIKLLRQASFISDEVSISNIIENGYENWVDSQFEIVGDLDSFEDEKYGYLESTLRFLNEVNPINYPDSAITDPFNNLDETLIDPRQIHSP